VQYAFKKFAEIGPIADKPVLDVPCGTGRFFPIYKEHGMHITGVDTSAEMLALAKNELVRTGVDMHTVKRGDIVDLASMFTPQQCEATVCCRLLNFGTADEKMASLA